MSRLMPYVVPFFTAWAILLAIWFYADLPLGPGNNIFIARCSSKAVSG